MATRRPRTAPTGAPEPDLLAQEDRTPRDYANAASLRTPAPAPAGATETHPAAAALSQAGFGPADNAALGEGAQPPAAHQRTHLTPEGDSVLVDEPAWMAEQRAAGQVPAKLSKLSVAMTQVTAHMTAIEALGTTIAEVEQQYPATHVFAVATKEGYKLADKVRADARKSRLHVADMRKQGTDLLNGLKTELWAVADPQIVRLQAIEDNAKAQKDAQDAKEATRIADHERNLAAITRMAEGAATMGSADLLGRRASLMAIVVDESYQEYEERAKKAHAEVAEVLTQAYEAAMKREAEAEAQRARDAQDKAARGRIAHYKGLPESVNEESSAAILQAITEIPAADNDEATYGALAEFVDMARDKALSVLNGMLKVAELNEEAARTPPVDPIEQESLHLADGDEGPHPFEPTLEEFADRVEETIRTDPAFAAHVNGTPQADPDPFTGPAPTPAPIAPPAARVARMALPTIAPAPAPTAAPSPAQAAAIMAADVYMVARRVRAAYVILSDAEASTLPAALRASLEELRRTLHV